MSLTLAVAVAATDRGDHHHAVDDGQARLTVLYVPAPGWAERAPDGRLTGVTVELMRAFADWLGEVHDIDARLDFVEETDWSHFYARVRDAEGGVFGIGNVTITEARREELAFSPPYLDNIAVLITHEQVATLARPERLSDAFDGLRGLAFSGTLHQQRLEALRDAHWPALEIDLATSNDEIIERVARGGHFGYIDGYNYLRAVDRGAALRHHPAFDDGGEAFGVIMPRDNDWQPLLADFFERDGGLSGSTFQYELLAEHLGEAVADLLTNGR